jgi:hypothetical protein
LPRDLDIVYIGAVLLYATEPEVVDVLRRVREAIRPDALVIIRDWCTFNVGRRRTNSGGGHWSIHRSPDELCYLATRVADIGAFTARPTSSATSPRQRACRWSRFDRRRASTEK